MIAIGLIWAGCAIAAALGLGVTVFALTDRRLKFVKSAVPVSKRRSTALTALLAIAGVLVAAGAAFGAIHSATSGFEKQGRRQAATGHFTSPLVTQNDPVPTVPLRMTVYVTAQLHGDVLVIGNATTKNPVATFQSSSPTAAKNTWSAYVTFGEEKNGGCVFNVWAMAMPLSFETYLLTEASSYNPNLRSSWMAPGLPPMPPATVLEHINVQRRACQVRNTCSC